MGTSGTMRRKKKTHAAKGQNEQHGANKKKEYSWMRMGGGNQTDRTEYASDCTAERGKKNRHRETSKTQ